MKDNLRRLTEPVEAVVQEPEHCQILNVAFSSRRVRLPCVSDHYTVVAHETTVDNAREIVNDGRVVPSDGETDLRDNAVFGWLFDRDIGYHVSDDIDRAVVFLKCRKENVYVSSYANLYHLYGGDIQWDTYDEKYAVKYSAFIDNLSLFNYSRPIKNKRFVSC